MQHVNSETKVYDSLLTIPYTCCAMALLWLPNCCLSQPRDLGAVVNCVAGVSGVGFRWVLALKGSLPAGGQLSAPKLLPQTWLCLMDQTRHF